MFREDLADFLLHARFEAGLSRPQLAELSGVSEDTILNVEKGHGAPRGQTIYSLARALRIERADLFAPKQDEVVEGAA